MHIPLVVSAIVTLRHLVSDTFENTGIAMEIGGVFASWIRRAKFTIVSTLFANNSGLTGVITGESIAPRPTVEGI